MSTISQNSTNALHALNLPAEFEDLEGMIRVDLRSMVVALAQRAGERLLLNPAQQKRLRADLWNQLAGAVNDAVAPLSAECR